MAVTPNLKLELFSPLGVGWREDATAGAILDYNMALIDVFAAGGGGGGAVASVNGKTGTVVLSYSDVGADASGAAATALSSAQSFATSAVATEASARSTADALLVPKTTTVNAKALSGSITLAFSDIASGALASGTTATTQLALDASTKVGTTGYTDSAVGVEKARAQAAENNMAIAGSAVAPTPAFSIPETNASQNPSFYVQDVNGNWHQQAGVDTSTVMSTNGGADSAPTVPQGVLTWNRMMYFRDSGSATQAGKNAFLSINHLAQVGTSYNNQDRAIWITMGNVYATINQFSIDGSNNVTFKISGITSGLGAPAFRVNQRVCASGLSTGTYLNSVNLSITSASAVSGGSQTLVCSDSGFTHATVTLTNDSGSLNQAMYSMANIQMEQDVVGSPGNISGVDTEFTTLSVQMSDQHIGSVAAPNYGCNGMRIQYYREAGAGVWGSVHPACIRSIVTDNNDGTHGSDTVTNILVQGNSTPGNNDLYYAVHVNAPAQRFGTGNYGLAIDDYGSNASDYALYITGGQIYLGGKLTGVGAWPSQTANTVLAGPTSGSAAAATFRALVPADLPTFVGDSGTGGVAGAVPAPPSGTGATGYFLSAAGNWQVPSVPASSVAWNNITSPSGVLTLSLAGNATTFQQTSAVVWLWQNTTTGTVSSTNASPILELAANYYTGSSGAQDTWTFGSALAAGANAISTLTIGHTGSTGAAQIQLPAPLSNGVTSPQIVGAAGATIGLSVGALAGAPCIIAAGSGSVDVIRGYQAGAIQGSISSQSSSVSFGLYTQITGGTTEVGNATSPSATNLKPLVSLGHGGTSWPTTGSGPYVGVNMGASIALGGGNSMHLNWAPTWGSGAFIAAQIVPTVNQPSISNTVAGSALVSNVGAIVFSTTNAFTAAALIQVALGTNTALNGTQTLVAQAQRAGSPYTITNSIENSASQATLTVGTHSVATGDWIYVIGLTTATWLNGQVVKVTSVVANTSITFLDQTTHGTAATHADTGTITCNYATFALTHANVTGVTDTGTVLQQSTGNYTALKIAVTETALQPSGSNKLIDCYAGSAGTTEVFSVDNAGNEVSYTPNGAQWISGSLTELLTLSTSGLTTQTVGNLLPANAIIQAVVCRVTTALTATTNWAVGDSTTTSRFSSPNATLTLGTTSVGLNHQQGGVSTNAAGPVQSAAAKVQVTCTGSNPGAGVIRITVFYTQFVAPTS